MDWRPLVAVLALATTTLAACGGTTAAKSCNDACSCYTTQATCPSTCTPEYFYTEDGGLLFVCAKPVPDAAVVEMMPAPADLAVADLAVAVDLAPLDATPGDAVDAN
jgi:hypothetical protein